MEIRADNADLIGYTFNLEELVIIKSAFENSTIRAYIQTHRTNFVTQHLMTPLLEVQSKGQDFQFNMALEEAYLKGVLDMCATLLETPRLPGEEEDGSTQHTT